MRTPSSEFRRPVGLTLPSTLVDVFDSTLRRGETRSGAIEELIRDELIRQGIDPDNYSVKEG